MVGRRPPRTSSGSELEDDANPQLAQLLEAVRELQEQNVEQQKQNDEHQRLQAEAQVREVELKQQLEDRERELRHQMEARERELREQLELLRNNVTGAETTRLMPKSNIYDLDCLAHNWVKTCVSCVADSIDLVWGIIGLNLASNENFISPMIQMYTLTVQFIFQKLYRDMIGSLSYLTASRPNILFSVCFCARL